MEESKSSCLICQRIKDIKDGTNPYFVKEMGTGYVVLCDHQYYPGYTLFLAKEHVHELHEHSQSLSFLFEMSMVAKAVCQAFTPDKLNYELLGNSQPHLHWHLIPRYKTDPSPDKPIWVVDKLTRDLQIEPARLMTIKRKLLATL